MPKGKGYGKARSKFVPKKVSRKTRRAIRPTRKQLKEIKKRKKGR